MFLQPEVQLLDVLEVNGWRFVTGGGVGLPSEVAQVANLLKGHHGVKRIVGWFLGSRVYVLALVMALLKRTNEPNPVVLRYDGKVLSGDYLWLMVENQPVIGKRFILSPGAVNTDGLFDICLVDNHKTKVEILSISRKVTMGEHVTLPSVTIARSHEMEMKFEKPVAFFGDGEEGPKGTDFQIKVLPRSLKLITGVAQEEPRTGKLVAPDASESLVRK
jgi:diacylglycerol kinase family enzyme